MDFEAEITGVVHGGHGICRHEGRVCFVPGALPGDVAAVHVARTTKGVWWGDIARLVTPSPDRVERPPCACFGRCGGCSWLHFAYPAQGEWKRRIVAESLRRLAGIEADIAWRDAPDLRLGYRTRARFHAKGGHVGFYAQGSHDVVDIAACPLCHPHLNDVLAQFHEMAADRQLPPDIEIEATVNPEGTETLVWTRRPCPALEKAFPFTDSQAAGRRPASFLFDGAPIVNGAFAQASLLLNRILVQAVRELVGDPTSLLDLYCGNGNLSRGAAVDVLGIDLDARVIHAAREAGGGAYESGGEDAFLTALERPWDAVVLDPPRTGAWNIVPALADARADRIVYVSCDPATLARDLKPLLAAGWRPEQIVAIDLFPHTPHVETVCLLQRG